MAKAKKKSARSPLQMQREINGLKNQLEYAEQCLRVARDETLEFSRRNTDLKQHIEAHYKTRDELVAQRDQATARAAEFEQHNGRLFSQLSQIQGERQMDAKRIEQATVKCLEAADRVSTQKAEIHALERALAIISGVRATV